MQYINTSHRTKFRPKPPSVAATAVGGGFSFATAPEVAGGPALRAMTLYENLFSAAKMVAV